MEEIDEIVRLVGLIWRKKSKRRMRDSEVAILRGCLGKKSYQAIAEELNSTERSVNTTAQPIWGALSELLGEKVTKPSCVTVLRDNIETLRQLASDEESPSVATFDGSSAPFSGVGSPPLGGSGEMVTSLPSSILAIDQPVETQILNRLKAAFQGNGGRIVVLAGLFQTGTSPLTIALVDAVRENFEYIVRFDAADVTTVADLGARLKSEVRSIEGIEDLASDLVLERLLIHQKLLIVIDRLEALFQQGLAGIFQETSACYARALQRLANITLSGSLLLVSRAIPHALSQQQFLRLGTATVPLYPLRGWPLPFERDWFEQQGVTAPSEAIWQELIAFCGGHPELLDTVVDHILNEFRNDVAAFLRRPGLALWQLRQLRQFMQQELAPEERVLLPWLVLKGLRPTELGTLWIPHFTPDQMVDALGSLERRNFIKKENGVYSFYPLAGRRCAEELWIDKLVPELCNNALDWLHRYPLLMLDAPEWQQQQQQRYVLSPLIEQLQRTYSSVDEKKVLINQLISSVRQSGYGSGNIGQEDYAIGNLLNIAAAWGLSFKDFDVSGTRLQHVDLRRANITGWQAQGCKFVQSALPVPMTSPLNAAMSSGGDWVVIGDSCGWVVWWRLTAQGLALAGHQKFSAPVDAIAVANGVIAVAVGKGVFVWWLPSNGQQGSEVGAPLFPVPEPVTCLTFNPDATHIAVGLANGQVMDWDLMGEEIYFDRPSHNHPVCQIVFKADGKQMASYCQGNQVFCHTLFPATQQSVKALPQDNYHGSRIGIGWHDDTLCAIEYTGRSNRVIWYNEQNEKLLVDNAAWDLAVCSGDGLTIAGYDIDGQVIISHHALSNAPRTVIDVAQELDGQRPRAMQLNNSGDLLMLCSDEHVYLWLIATREFLWRQQATDPGQSWMGCDLSGSTGIPLPYQNLLNAMGITLNAS